MKDCVIGISMSETSINEGVFTGFRRSSVSKNYVTAISAAEAVPILIPYTDDLCEGLTVDRYLDRIDGLLLTGGQDVNPQLYGEEPRSKLGDIWESRDRYDLALLEAAERRQIPVFGICRGFQLMAIKRGGKILQDLSYSEKELLKHEQEGPPDAPSHYVDFVGENPFTEVFGSAVRVNSYHHQAVIDAGRGLEVCGRSRDGVIEAVFDPEKCIMGTQWHPELMAGASDQMQALFIRFVELCREARQQRNKA